MCRDVHHTTRRFGSTLPRTLLKKRKIGGGSGRERGRLCCRVGRRTLFSFGGATGRERGRLCCGVGRRTRLGRPSGRTPGAAGWTRGWSGAVAIAGPRIASYIAS
jgi:hypothetical protein